MDVFHVFFVGVALYYYWKFHNKQFIKPRQPSGCRCAGMCHNCQEWKKWVRSQKPPCPGDEKWYWFDEWNGKWTPRQITHFNLDNIKSASNEMESLKESLDYVFKQLKNGNELFTLEKPPTKYK